MVCAMSAQISTKPPCAVCGAPSHAKKLCEKHYRRLLKHGYVHSRERPSDWGERFKHPLYWTWDYTKKTHVGVCDEWRNDFWQFVKDVGERPSDRHSLSRYDKTEPFSPSNTYWREKQFSASHLRNAEYQKQWTAANPHKRKGQYLKKHYGISLADYTAMLEAQDNRCAICRKTHDGNFALAVDHCHDSKAVRGLLCTNCNRGLGHFKDDPALLERAAQYLRKHHSSELPFT